MSGSDSMKVFEIVKIFEQLFTEKKGYSLTNIFWKCFQNFQTFQSNHFIEQLWAAASVLTVCIFQVYYV